MEKRKNRKYIRKKINEKINLKFWFLYEFTGYRYIKQKLFPVSENEKNVI